MASDNRQLIEDIKSKLDIVDVIGESITLKKKGSAYVGATSQMSKSGSSLHVDKKTQLFNDFANGTGGDVFNWIALSEGLDVQLDFSQILKIAAEKAGVQLPEHDTSMSEERKDVFIMLRAAAGYYHSQLTDEHRQYIKSTWGINNKTIDDLLIGYAPKGNCLESEMSMVYHNDDLKKTGLFYADGTILTDVFRDRIMFPYWKNGNVVYFIGRDPDWSKETNSRKYIKQPVQTEERPYISSVIDNSVFYGEDTIKRSDTVLITEGVTDCIMAMQGGVPCISPVTIRIKDSEKEHAYDLVKRKSRIIICNDNEDNGSGLTGATDTAEYLESKGIHVELITLPRDEGVDKIDLAEYLSLNSKDDLFSLPINNVWEIKLSGQNVPKKTIEKLRAAIHFVANDLKCMDKDIKKHFVKNDVREYFGMTSSEINDVLKAASCTVKTDKKSDDGFFDDHGRLLTQSLSERVMQDNRFITFEDTKRVYFYKNGVYVQNGEDLITRSVHAILGDATKKHHVAEIIHYIQFETLIPRSHINNGIDEINFLNGVYDRRTRTLSEHSPDNISIVQIPVTYDPAADCPAFIKFASEVMHHADIPIIFEFIGYCMIPDTTIEKALMLYGKRGANGKSKMLAAIGSIIGSQNTSEESLQMLEKDPYAMAELYGKMVNIFPDIPSTTIYDNSTFKLLTGDEACVRGRRIYEAPFKFKNTARLIFSANTPPNIPGDDLAYYRRWVMLEFPNHFVEGSNNTDKDIVEKITTEEEKSGIVNIALIALDELMERGKYSYDLNSEQTHKLYRLNSDPIAAFADERVVYSDDNCPKSTMFEHYATWCKINSTAQLAENIFGKRMKKLGYVDARNSSGDRKMVWLNCNVQINVNPVRDTKRNPDGKNQYQDTNPSGLPGLVKTLLSNIEKNNENGGKKEEIYCVYTNNRDLTMVTLTDEAKNDNGEDCVTRQGSETNLGETPDGLEDQQTTIKDLRMFIGGHSDQRENLNDRKFKMIAFDFCQAHPRVYKNPGKIEALINKMAINGSLWQ
jgi:DNA primase catalytic core